MMVVNILILMTVVDKIMLMLMANAEVLLWLCFRTDNGGGNSEVCCGSSVNTGGSGYGDHCYTKGVNHVRHTGSNISGQQK